MCDKTATYRYICSDEAVNSYSCDKCREEFGHAHGPLNFCCVCGVKFSGERECRPKYMPRWKYEKTIQGYRPDYSPDLRGVARFETMYMVKTFLYKGAGGFTTVDRKPLHGWAQIGSDRRRFQTMIEEIKMAKNEYLSVMPTLIESMTITFELEIYENMTRHVQVWVKKEEENS